MCDTLTTMTRWFGYPDKMVLCINSWFGYPDKIRLYLGDVNADFDDSTTVEELLVSFSQRFSKIQEPKCNRVLSAAPNLQMTIR